MGITCEDATKMKKEENGVGGGEGGGVAAVGGGEGRRGGRGYRSQSLCTTGQVMIAFPSLHLALNMTQLDCIFHAQNATRSHNASVNSV